MIVIIKLENQKKPLIYDYIEACIPNEKKDELLIHSTNKERVYKKKLSEIEDYDVYDNSFNTEIK